MALPFSFLTPFGFFGEENISSMSSEIDMACLASAFCNPHSFAESHPRYVSSFSCHVSTPFARLSSNCRCSYPALGISKSSLPALAAPFHQAISLIQYYHSAES